MNSFWEFSFNEIAELDTPAIIDYVMKVNGHHGSLGWVGHGAGADMMLAHLSVSEKDNHLIRPFVMLAPTPFVPHSRFTIQPSLWKRQIKSLIKRPGQMFKNTDFWKLFSR